MSHVPWLLNGAACRSVRTVEFQLAFSELFRVVFLASLVSLEAACLWIGGASEWWLLVGVLPPMIALLSALSVGLLIWRFRFTIGPEGIACYDFWCRPITTPWDEMQQVSRIALPGLAYVRITSTGRRQALWLPLFVPDVEGLQQVVSLHAGPSHPLTRLLHGYVNE